MDEIEKQVIQTKLTYLQRELNTVKVIDFLYAETILERDDVQRLLAEVVDSSCVRGLILILPLRGAAAFPAFIRALRETGQTHIMSTLLEEEKQLRQKKIEDGV
jgi:Caspase recruitment domain